MNLNLVKALAICASLCCSANAFGQWSIPTPSFSMPSLPPPSKIGGSISGGFHQAEKTLSGGAQHVTDMAQKKVVDPQKKELQKVQKLGTSAPPIFKGSPHIPTKIGVNAVHIGNGSLGTTGTPIRISSPSLSLPKTSTTTAKLSSGWQSVVKGTQHASSVVDQGTSRWNSDPMVHNSTTNKWLTNFDSGTLPVRNGIAAFASVVGTGLAHAMLSHNSGAQDQGNQGQNQGKGQPGNGSSDDGSGGDTASQPQQVSGGFEKPNNQGVQTYLTDTVRRSSSTLQKDPRHTVTPSR